MEDKTIVITGASSGIGLAAAIALAREVGQLVLVCRDPQRAVAAQERIAHEAGGRRPKIVLADFLSQQEVRSAAEEIARDFDTIDVLVNNAGAIFARRELTADGVEQTFAVNHLAPFLLTNLLLGNLLNARAARVVTVTSETYSKQLDFDNLQGERSYNFFRAYQSSKLANILFTNELARMMQGTNVTANSVSPGPAVTRFGDDLTGLPSLMPKVMKRIPFLFKPPEIAAAGVVRLASSAELEGVSGRFFLRTDEEELKPGARDVDAAKRLWAVSTELAAVDTAEPSLRGLAAAQPDGA